MERSSFTASDATPLMKKIFAPDSSEEESSQNESNDKEGNEEARGQEEDSGDNSEDDAKSEENTSTVEPLTPLQELLTTMREESSDDIKQANRVRLLFISFRYVFYY